MKQPQPRSRPARPVHVALTAARALGRCPRCTASVPQRPRHPRRVSSSSLSLRPASWPRAVYRLWPPSREARLEGPSGIRSSSGRSLWCWAPFEGLWRRSPTSSPSLQSCEIGAFCWAPILSFPVCRMRTHSPLQRPENIQKTGNSVDSVMSAWRPSWWERWDKGVPFNNHHFTGKETEAQKS